MSAVEVQRITKRFGRLEALAQVSLTVVEGELLALLGPSGCGKTTLLRCVAGLASPDDGIIRLDDADVTDLPARARDVGMVFQSYALFPNLTAAANIGFPLEARRWESRKRLDEVERLLALVGLTDIAGRYPHQLSGGQQQRVALARALAGQPKVLLLDEPLSALDALTRTALRDEIRRIQLKLGMTAIYVTHDQAEALAIADRIGVMENGRLVELGQPTDVYLKPTSRFGAEFLGSRNTLELVVGEDGYVRWGDAFAVPVAWPPGQRVMVAFTPESVELDCEQGMPGTISLVSFRGAITHFQVTTASGEIGVDVPSLAAGRYVPGRATRVRIPPELIGTFVIE
jgi:putative spermidine/putrescine transport system ATP-binding protein